MLISRKDKLKRKVILYTFPSSPFGSKVHAVILACGFEQSVTFELFHPWLSDTEFRKLNPLGKIPVLKTSDDIIFDSPVICEYLMEKSGMLEKLMPNRFKSLKIQAIVDGINDAAVSIRYERFFRPNHLQCIDWYDRLHLALTSGLAYLDNEKLTNELTFENLCVTTMLSYLDMRFADSAFNISHQNLYGWHNEFLKLYQFLDKARAKDYPVPEGVTRLHK